MAPEQPLPNVHTCQNDADPLRLRHKTNRPTALPDAARLSCLAVARRAIPPSMFLDTEGGSITSGVTLTQRWWPAPATRGPPVHLERLLGPFVPARVLRCQIRRSLRACRRLRAAPCKRSGVSRWNQTTAPVAVVVSPGGGYTERGAAFESNVIPVAGAVVVGPNGPAAESFKLATMAALAPPIARATRAAARTTIRWRIPRVISATSKWPSAGKHSKDLPRRSASFESSSRSPPASDRPTDRNGRRAGHLVPARVASQLGTLS